MYFAEFYKRNLDGSIGEALGDRSVLILDGRESETEHHSHAKEWAQKHKYCAYTLAKGANFSRVQKRSKMYYIGASA